MPSLLIVLTAAEITTITLAAALVVLAAFGFRAWRRSRMTPEERERHRCALLVAAGKITDAALVEIRDVLVFYSYSVRGVEYTASQDISRFSNNPSVDFSCVIAMSVKYDPRNPANSIVLAEAWSGLRAAPRPLPENHPHV
jgi:hypothetical protein